MAWSTNTETGNLEFTTTEVIDGASITVTEVFDTSFNPISSSWNDGTNSSSIAEAVDDVTFDFNNDGSKLYVNNDNRVYQYNLSTPFSLSTAAFVSSTDTYREHLFDNHMTLGTGIDIDSNEKKFYISYFLSTYYYDIRYQILQKQPLLFINI